MASWMVHLRIADAFLDIIENLHVLEFIVGNIAPDSGEPNADFSEFTPSPVITHWTNSNKKEDIRAEDFFNEYIRNKELNAKTSFYLGYYIHLLTDIAWAEQIFQKTKQEFEDEFVKNKHFIDDIKDDWYDQDHMFLKNNPDFRAFRIFQNINSFPNIYLHYFSEHAFEKKIAYIANFYSSFTGEVYREYRYLSKENLSDFVERLVNELKIKLSNHEIIIK